MRIIKDKKGQIRVIEAFFASVLLLSSLTLIPMVQRNQNSNASFDLSSKALNILVSLDSDGHLGNLIDAQNWAAIQNLIQSCVPPTIWFNLTVLNQNMLNLNDVQISNGGLVSDKIFSADYFCASTNAIYALYIIRLQLAAVD